MSLTKKETAKSNNKPMKNTAIRILPMSMTEEFVNQDIHDIQQNYFLNELKENNEGHYLYREKGIKAVEGDLVLFQFGNQIIASANYSNLIKHAIPIEGIYNGSIVFDKDSIQVFKPITAAEISTIDSDFKRFSQAKQSISPSNYEAIVNLIDQKVIQLGDELTDEDWDFDEEWEPFDEEEDTGYQRGSITVRTKADILDNIGKLNAYLEDDDLSEYAKGLIKRASCFVALKNNDEYSFFPSRFIGYVNNTKTKHDNNPYKNGGVTNEAISSVLRRELKQSEELETQYLKYCYGIGITPNQKASFGMERKFWLIDLDQSNEDDLNHDFNFEEDFEEDVAKFDFDETPSILDIHKQCFEFLDSYTVDGEKLLFLPRKKDTKFQKREDGYYFIGNKEYLQITFWKGDDSLEKIHNISFMILSNGTSYIEISSRDDESKAERLRALVDYLTEHTRLKFDEIKADKWNAKFEGDDYLGNLGTFIENEKKIIDGFIVSECNSQVELVYEGNCKKYIEAIKNIEEKYSGSKPQGVHKKTVGSFNISKSDYQMSLLHNEIQNSLRDVLKRSGRYKSVELELNHVDITAFRKDGKLDFYELKIGKAKSAIRQALGQILEYNHYPNQKKADQMFIVSNERPAEADVEYLNHLRAVYGLNLYYRYFNVVDNELSESY